SKSKRNELVLLGNPTNKFDLEDLSRASAEVLGKGTLRTTYKADQEVGTTTVVMQRQKDVILSTEYFRDKVEVVGATDHGWGSHFLSPPHEEKLSLATASVLCGA
ncbi:hypothetical protein ACJRO7_014685, partial [Eucalyptus globulus]